MGAYKNGVSTRKVILQVCRKLFYDKGYHETSYDDICNAAHVNRGSIYYHFKEKENIRYEVLWGMHKECQDIAAKYCDRQEHVFKIGSYILWGKTLVDEKLRKFELDYYNDYPVYTPNNPVALYYKMCNQNMFSELGELKKIKPLALATVYGNIYGVLRLVDADPDRFSLDEIFENVVISGIMILGLSKEKAEAMKEEWKIYVDKIPEEVFRGPLGS